MAETGSLTGYKRMTGVCALVFGGEDEEAAGLETKMGFAAGTSSCGNMCERGVGAPTSSSVSPPARACCKPKVWLPS